MTLPSPLIGFSDGAVSQTLSPVVMTRLNNLSKIFPAAAEHRRMLRLLGSDFVYASPVHTANGRPTGNWIALIRFGGQLEDRFAIGAEVIAIYAAHDDLQARTVDTVESHLVQLPPERQSITREFILVWSRDIRLAEKLAAMSRPGRALLPLEGSGTATDAATFLSTLASRLYSRDLYSEHSFVTGSQFYGREQILAEIADDIKQQRIPAIFGMRKTGKTSILKELERTNKLSSDFGRQMLYVYSDLEHLPSIELGDPVRELVHDLREMVRDTLSKHGFRTKEIAELADTCSINEFHRALDYVLRHPANSDMHLTIILDEIEYLCPPSAEDEHVAAPLAQAVPQFFGVVRKLTQERDNFSFVIAGLASASVEAGTLFGRHNPLFSYAKPYYMRPFTVAEAEDLLNGIGRRLGVKWSEDAVSVAHSETGGHVLLLRELASRCFKEFPSDRASTGLIDSELLDRVLPKFTRAIAGNLKEILNHVELFYHDEWDLLQTLRRDPKDFAELASGYQSAIGRLERLGLIFEADGTWSPTRIVELSWQVTLGTDAGAKTSSVVSDSGDQDLAGLIELGESRVVEFKSTFRSPLNSEIPEKTIVDSALVAIVGMLNSCGGTLLVGIDDDGASIGLDADLARAGSRDKLIRDVSSSLNGVVGPGIASTIGVQFVSIDNRDLIRVDVPASDDAIWPNRALKGKNDVLWVRQGANTEALPGPEAASYIRRQWPQA